MKKSILFILSLVVFFAGLGSVAEKVGARFKSDEKALELIRAARVAIGGDNSIAGVQGLRIKGTTVHTFKIDGTEKTEPGESEIALQFPDKVYRSIRIGDPDEAKGGQQMVQKHVETVILTKTADGSVVTGTGEGQGTGVGAPQRMKVVVLNNGDGLPGDVKTEGGQTVILRKTADDDLPAKTESGEIRRVAINKGEMEAKHKVSQQNELFRLSLGLLLSPPPGMDVNYTFGGETSVDGTPCNIVNAEFAGSSVKLLLNKSSNLPVEMTYSGEAMPVMVKFRTADAASEEPKENVMFVRHGDLAAPGGEITVKYSDYRNVNGVQLPFHWSTSGGDMSEEFTVTSYEFNPADIQSGFEKPKVEFRVKKDGQ